MRSDTTCASCVERTEDGAVRTEDTTELALVLGPLRGEVREKVGSDVREMECPGPPVTFALNCRGQMRREQF
jgi:hypothetical protein